MYQKIYHNRKLLLNILFLLYLAGVLGVTFIVRETMVLRTPENRGVILQPFREWEAMLTKDHMFWFKQIALNILLFVPFGILLPMVSKRVGNPFIVIAVGCLFSGAIEFMQYVTGRGLTEVDDVITNTIGAAVGVGIYQLVSAVMRIKNMTHGE